MYIVLILFSLMLSAILGMYIGYYIALTILSVKILEAELKVMKWEDDLFAYRPRSISKPVKKGDLIAIKADEDIVNVVNILIKKEGR